MTSPRAKPKAKKVEFDLQEIVDDIARRMASETERGAQADYIPELAEVDINQFGIAVVPVEGDPVAAGDADVPFSIQSISKVFTLTLALEKAGADLWARVGREPSGDPFNSIVQLEYEHGKPRNPFINAGAIVVTDVVLDGRPAKEALDEILEFCRHLADDKSIEIDARVARSEDRTGSRNRALANFMLAEGNMINPVERTLDVYFGHCAIAMSCRQLAMAGRFLASSGHHRRAGPSRRDARPRAADQRADDHVRPVRRLGRVRVPGGRPVQKRRGRRDAGDPAGRRRGDGVVSRAR